MSDLVLSELRAIRADIQAQAVMLARVDERMVALDEKVDDHLKTDKDFHAGIEKRVGVLEHFKTRIAAFVAFLGLLGAALGGVIGDAIASVADALR